MCKDSSSLFLERFQRKGEQVGIISFEFEKSSWNEDFLVHRKKTRMRESSTSVSSLWSGIWVNHSDLLDTLLREKLIKMMNDCADKSDIFESFFFGFLRSKSESIPLAVNPDKVPLRKMRSQSYGIFPFPASKF